MNSGYIVEISNVSFKYQEDKPILNNVSLKVKKGEVIGIVGLSGSGKTTLINILNGVIPRRVGGKFSGEVFIKGEDIAGKDISELASAIGTVFQDPDNQIVFSTVEDEIAFGPENLCVSADEILHRIAKITKLLQIEGLRYRNPNNLSGGEKQLVVIASVLSLNVEVLILDESMAQIDNRGRKLMIEAIKNLKNNGKTIIMVEHDFNNLSIADKIYVIAEGELKLYNGKLK